jgi:hypothetical protein
MEFSTDELFEIEKLCDFQVGALLHHVSEISLAIGHSKDEEAVNLCHKAFKDSTRAYDMLRTISAKCASTRIKIDSN